MITMNKPLSKLCQTLSKFKFRANDVLILQGAGIFGTNLSNCKTGVILPKIVIICRIQTTFSTILILVFSWWEPKKAIKQREHLASTALFWLLTRVSTLEQRPTIVGDKSEEKGDDKMIISRWEPCRRYLSSHWRWNL